MYACTARLFCSGSACRARQQEWGDFATQKKKTRALDSLPSEPHVCTRSCVIVSSVVFLPFSLALAVVALSCRRTTGGGLLMHFLSLSLSLFSFARFSACM